MGLGRRGANPRLLPPLSGRPPQGLADVPGRRFACPGLIYPHALGVPEHGSLPEGKPNERQVSAYARSGALPQPKKTPKE